MDVTPFEEDDKGNTVSNIGDVTVIITIHGDTVMIEQDGGHDGLDLIMMSDPEQVRLLIDRLQWFLDAQ